MERSLRGKGRSPSSTNEHVLDSVTWSRWERRRYDMRRATNAKPNNSIAVATNSRFIINNPDDGHRHFSTSESDDFSTATVTRDPPAGTIISVTDLRNSEMYAVSRSNSSTFPRSSCDIQPVNAAAINDDNIIIPLTISNNNTLPMTRSTSQQIPTAVSSQQSNIAVIPVTRSIGPNIVTMAVSNNNILMTKSMNDLRPSTTISTHPSDARILPVTRSTSQSIIPVIVSNNNTLPMVKSVSEAIPITMVKNNTLIPISRSRELNIIPVTEFRDDDMIPVTLSSRETIHVSSPTNATILPLLESSSYDSRTSPINDTLIHVAVPSNGGQVLPVTYVRVVSDGSEYVEPLRPSPVLQEEYICF